MNKIEFEKKSKMCSICSIGYALYEKSLNDAQCSY